MKAKKLGLVFGIVTAVTFVFASCAAPADQATEEPDAAAPEEVFEWKFQNNNTADSPQYEACEAWARSVEQASNGRLKITLFPAGQVVQVPDYIDALRNNVVQIATTWGGYFKDTIPEGAVQAGLPMIYRSQTEIQYLHFELGLIEPLREAYAEHGCYVYGIGAGPPVLLWATEPVKTLDDFEGLKVRAAGDDSTMLANMGAAATYIPHEEGFTALQLGTVEAYSTAYVLFQADKHYEICKYLMRPALHGASLDMFSMSMEAFEELPDDLQELLKAQAPVLNWNESWRTDLDVKRIDAKLGDWGVEVIQMSDEVVQKMTEEGLKLLEGYKGKTEQCAVMVEIIKSYMEEFGYI
jgi:TRAP-type C4-dicarboxylate transport system substrate-binding protein